MTSSETNGNGRRSSGGLADTLMHSPAVERLGDAAKDYAKARGGDVVRNLAGRVGNVTESLNDKGDNGGFKGAAASGALKRIGEGDSPVKAALGGVGTGIKEKVKSAFGRSGRSQKFMNILEDITVGVPVDVAYNQWTQFQEFASFMKGVDSVDQTDEVTTSWKVKVFKSRRTWKGTVQEQVPDRKIAWSTDGPKGTTKGVVTFHPLADDLTQILLVMEYYPQGFFEKTGNLWRAPGRRARLDLKNFRRFIMMRGEETGSWRGEIRDGEVVRQPDEEEEPQDRSPQARGGEDQEEGQEEEQPEGAQAEEEGYEEEEPEEEEPQEDEEEEEEPEEDYEGAEAEDEEEDEEDYEGAEAEGEPAEDEEEPEGAEAEADEAEEGDEAEEPEEEPANGPPRRGARRREPVGAGRRR
jgi:uncharacterized membrane protein